MELILWRHADAEDGAPDLERRLTKKGRKQAERVAKWLRERLPEEYELISSPAARARETAEALGEKLRIDDALAPGASPSSILEAAGWPSGGRTVIIVGHQPDLGRALAHLVARRQSDWRLQKGALWWLEAGEPPLVKAVISADLV
jgi:phosphohistidine phosphatase